MHLLKLPFLPLLLAAALSSGIYFIWAAESHAKSNVGLLQQVSSFDLVCRSKKHADAWAGGHACTSRPSRSATASRKCSLLRKMASFALPTRPDGTDLCTSKHIIVSQQHPSADSAFCHHACHDAELLRDDRPRGPAGVPDHHNNGMTLAFLRQHTLCHNNALVNFRRTCTHKAYIFMLFCIAENYANHSREEGAAAEHAGLEQAAGRAQEELHVVTARKLRQPRVQLR